MESSTSCYVNKKFYPHLLLIPAVIIVTVLAFLNKRRSFKKDVWGGRPGLVIPLDFLGIDHNRLAVSAIFAVAVGMIIQVVLGVSNIQISNSNWLRALVTIAYALEVAMLFYPFFACLSTEHKLIGSIMGLLYTILWCTLDMLKTFDKCLETSNFLPAVLTITPAIVCYVFILGRFSIILYLETRNCISWNEESEQDLGNTVAIRGLTKPWLIQHVRELLKPRTCEPEKRWIRFLRLIYSPKPNFRFSVQTVSIVVVCCIFLYMITLNLMIIGYALIESKAKLLPSQCSTNLVNGLGGSFVTSVLLVALVCMLSIVRFMDCHKNNMLRIFKGDTSFIPKGLEKSQLMVGKCLKYAGFQIGYFVWGYMLLLFIFFLLTSAIAVISYCGLARKLLKPVPEYLIPLLCITLPVWFFMIGSSVTIFRDRYFKNDVIAIDNRNVYLVFSYFYFFLGLPVGFFSAMLRVLKAIPIGFFMLPRVDQCVMLDGFQRFDNGFAAYVCYLHVQAAHRNPILRVFCQIVHDEMRNTRDPGCGTLRATKRYRNKWLLLVTLMRNPQLQGCRKHVIAPPIVIYSVNDVDVSVELPNV